MLLPRSSAALLIVCFIVGCGDKTSNEAANQGGVGEPLPKFVGKWTVDWDAAAQDRNAPPGAQEAAKQVTLEMDFQGDGSYRFFRALPGEPPNVESGTWKIAQVVGNVFTIELTTPSETNEVRATVIDENHVTLFREAWGRDMPLMRVD